MAKLITPPSIIKVSKKDAIHLTDKEYQAIWPLGSLYLHPPTGIYFRFVKTGSSRWDNTYGISTQKGIFRTRGFSHNNDCGIVINYVDKTELMQRLLGYLQTLNV